MSVGRLWLMRSCCCSLVLVVCAAAVMGASHGTSPQPPSAAAVIAPKNVLVSSRRRNAAAVCSTIEFRRQLLVSFQGRPGNITSADVQLFQRSFQQVYNNIKCGINATLTFRRITNVNATRNAVISYGFSATNTASDFIDQQFTWIVQVQGTCQGCTTPTFQLFATDPPAPTPPTPPSSPPPSGCFCSAPRKVPFLRRLNRRSLLPNGIDKVLSIVLLFQQSRCPAVEVQFETFVAVTYTGGNVTNTTASTNTTTQNQLLAQSVLETYNDANALNTAGVCDTQYHSLTSIQVIAATTTAIPSSRRTLAKFNFLNFKRNFIFLIRGTCRGCTSSTALFDDVVGRRRLSKTATDAMAMNQEDSVMLDLPLHHKVSTWHTTTDKVIDVVAFPNAFHRQLPVLDGQCYCQATTTSRRIPTKGEFIQALNDRFGDIGPQGAGVVTIASAVQNIAQLVLVNCSNRINQFTTTVTVGIFSNRTLSSQELAQLGTAFQTTYNGLNQLYCDPVFRGVLSVQVKYRRRQRQLLETAHRDVQQQERVAFVHFVVQAQCRGCSSGTTLFANSGTGRSLQQHVGGDQELGSSVDPSDEVQNDNAWRSLGKSSNQAYVASCFCQANSIAFTAPTKFAFQKAFNQSVAALDKSLSVYSVN